MTTTKLQSAWRETKLGEVAEIKGGKRLPAGKSLVSIKTNHPYIRITDLENNRIKKHQLQFVPNDVFPVISKYIVHSGDIIVSIVGSIGFVAKIDQDLDNANLTENCVKIINLNGLDSDFLYYFLISGLGQNEIAKNTVGAVQKKLPIYGVQNINLLLPLLHEQRAIAAVLSSFDDKIELLRNQNKTLESIAQQLFHEWFVEFNFPNESGKPYKKSGGKMVDGELGEMPEGWKTSGLSEIADFLNGLALQKFPPESPSSYLPVIKIREMKSGISDQTDKASANLNEKYVVHDGDILFSWSGSLEVVVWKYGKGALNQHLFKVTSQNYPKWFYYHWLMRHLEFFRMIASVKATTMGHIQRYHLDEAKVIIPTETVMKKADKVFAPLFDKMIANNAHISSLTLAREALLPPMMSGEVRVKETVFNKKV